MAIKTPISVATCGGLFFFKSNIFYKKIIRLTESDLTRIVRRVIREQEETSVESEIDAEIDNIDRPEPTILQKIIDKIERAGKNVDDYLDKLSIKNAPRARKLKNLFVDCESKKPLRFKNPPKFLKNNL
jgi:hypothetical protein